MSLQRNCKRILCALLCAFLVFSLCSCAKSNSKNPQASSSQTEEVSNDKNKNDVDDSTEKNPNNLGADYKKTLVLYFSCTGNTAQIASYIAELKNADLLEIEPEKPYTSEDLSRNESSRAFIEQTSEANDVKIKSHNVNLTGYDTIYIGYPIWYSKAPRAVCTFLKENEMTSKTIVPFCTSDESTIESSVDELKALQPDAIWENGFRFDGTETQQSVEQILKRQP